MEKPSYEALEQRVKVLEKAASHQKQAEAALKASEDKYKRFFDNAVVGIFNSTAEGKFIMVNQAFAAMLGYNSPQELLSSISDIATQYYADPKDRLTYQKALRDNHWVDNMEYRVQRKDGSLIWISNSTRACLDKNGTLIGYDGIIIEITDRKKAEKEKEKLLSQLNHAQKLESIGTLAGGIAHDFNNILSSIIGYTQLAMDGVEKETPLYEDLSEILIAGNRAAELVRQILTMSRNNRQETVPLRIAPLVKEVLKMLRSTIPASIEIRERIAGEPLVVKADPTQLHQVIVNLATNAKQAMADATGVLEVRVEKTTFSSSIKNQYPDMAPGNYVQLSVSDTGCGIPADHLDRIFEPYFTTREKETGTGLGLSVVHGIVKSYKGHITAYSQPGQGTTFHVFLPLVTQKAAGTPAIKEEPPPGGNERILLVDDEQPILKIHRQLLEKLGYSVTARTSSVEALEAFQMTPARFDLVMTDMAMPNMAGDRLALAVKQIRPEIPVILCTGFSEALDNHEKNSGIDGFLMKPLDRTKLAKTVRALLNGQKG